MDRVSQIKAKYNTVWENVQDALPTHRPERETGQYLNVSRHFNMLNCVKHVPKLVADNYMSMETLVELNKTYTKLSGRTSASLLALYTYALLARFVSSLPETASGELRSNAWTLDFVEAANSYFHGVEELNKLVVDGTTIPRAKGYSAIAKIQPLANKLGTLPCMHPQLQRILRAMTGLYLCNSDSKYNVDRVTQELEWVLSYYGGVVQNLIKDKTSREAMLTVIHEVVPPDSIASAEIILNNNYVLELPKERIKFTGKVPFTVKGDLMFNDDRATVGKLTGTLKTAVPFKNSKLVVAGDFSGKNLPEITEKMAATVIATLDAEFSRQLQDMILAAQERDKQLMESVKSKLTPEEMAALLRTMHPQ